MDGKGLGAEDAEAVAAAAEVQAASQEETIRSLFSSLAARQGATTNGPVGVTGRAACTSLGVEAAGGTTCEEIAGDRPFTTALLAAASGCTVAVSVGEAEGAEPGRGSAQTLAAGVNAERSAGGRKRRVPGWGDAPRAVAEHAADPKLAATYAHRGTLQETFGAVPSGAATVAGGAAF